MRPLPALALAAQFGLPAAGAADQLRYDPAILTACLNGEPLAAACVGRAAADCMTKEGAPDYGAIVMLCSSAEAQQWEGLMELADAKLREEAPDLSPDARQGGAPPPLELLEAMRQDWTTFRISALSYESSRWSGGSGEGPETARSHLNLTAAQTIWLMRAAGDLSDRSSSE